MTCLTDNQSKIYSEKPASYSWTVSQSVAAKGEEDEAGWRIMMWQILHAKLVEWCASVGVIKRINICICTHPKHTRKQHNGKCWFFPLKKKKKHNSCVNYLELSDVDTGFQKFCLLPSWQQSAKLGSYFFYCSNLALHTPTNLARRNWARFCNACREYRILMRESKVRKKGCKSKVSFERLLWQLDWRWGKKY